MRISDWSSDVCSSDLHGAAVRRSEQRVSLQRLRDVDVATPLDFLGILDHRRLQRIEARALDTRTGDDDVFPGGFRADVRLRAVRRAADHHRAIGVLATLEALVREPPPPPLARRLSGVNGVPFA